MRTVIIKAFDTLNDRNTQNFEKSKDLDPVTTCKDFRDRTNAAVTEGKALAYYTESGRELSNYEEAWKYLGGRELHAFHIGGDTKDYLTE